MERRVRLRNAAIPVPERTPDRRKLQPSDCTSQIFPLSPMVTKRNFRSRGIQFLLETPTYNRDPDQWSLRRLSGLKPGQAVTHDGLTFTGLSLGDKASMGSAFRESRRSRWFVGGDGATVFQRYQVSLIQVDTRILE